MLVMRSKPNRRACAGESMLVVVAMMLVFFLLGVAVLTAASAVTGAASARVMERQGYYYARSMVDTLDASLQLPDGKLGKALEKAIVDDVKANGIAEGSIKTRTYTKKEPFTLVFVPSFTGSAADYTLSDLNGTAGAETKNLVTISCVGRAYVTLTTGSVTAYTLDLRQMSVTYDCAYKAFVTRSYVRYTLFCKRDGFDEATGSDTSHDVTWTIKGAG